MSTFVYFHGFTGFLSRIIYSKANLQTLLVINKICSPLSIWVLVALTIWRSFGCYKITECYTTECNGGKNVEPATNSNSFIKIRTFKEITLNWTNGYFIFKNSRALCTLCTVHCTRYQPFQTSQIKIEKKSPVFHGHFESTFDSNACTIARIFRSINNQKNERNLQLL